MKSYRFKLRPQSPWITPWQADTIFGSLCWELRKLQGEAALVRFLEGYVEGRPAFVISDALPEGFLPCPLFARLQPLQLNFKGGLPDWMPEQQFRAFIRRPEPMMPQPSWPKPFRRTRELHASIDRLVGGTGEEGNLFELAEWSFHSGIERACQNLSLYVRTEQALGLDLFTALLRSLAASGFGKKKSTGRGAFQIVGEAEPCAWMDEFAGANGFVSLSHFVPHPADPTDGVWSLLTKYPKFAAGAPVENPFKGRLTMLRPGAAFRVQGTPRPFYGKVLRGLSHEFPGAVHYGLAFPAPTCWPKEE